MHEREQCCDEVVSHQLPIAAAFWVIWIVSVEECSSLMQNLMQIFTHSVILNTTAKQYPCSLSGVYHPHWLIQWRCHYSHMHIPVHALWLPGYIDVMHCSCYIKNGWTFSGWPFIYLTELLSSAVYSFSQEERLSQIQFYKPWGKILTVKFWSGVHQ